MTVEQLNILLREGKFDRLLPLAEHERKAHPDEPIFAAIVATCLNGLGRHGRARNLARNAIRKFPDNPQLHFELGQSHLALRESEEAEEAYVRAIELIGDDDDVRKSAYMTGLGGAQWALKKRENAIGTWREASRLDPGNEAAREQLDKYLNAYGEPRAPTPVFDDVYHFYTIQKRHYFQSRGSQSHEFESKEEFEHVYAAMARAWNEQIAPLKDRTDAMSPAEKTELFSSTRIDFTEEIPTSDMPRVFTPAEPATKSPSEVGEPNVERLTDILFSLPLLALVGVTRERADELVEGCTPTPQELEILSWGADVVGAVFDAIEFVGENEEVEAMMDAVAIACERVAPEEAPVSVREIRRIIEAFIAAVEKTWKKKRNKKKRKK